MRILMSQHLWLQAGEGGWNLAAQPREPFQVCGQDFRPAAGIQLQRTPHQHGSLCRADGHPLVCLHPLVDHQAAGLPQR